MARLAHPLKSASVRAALAWLTAAVACTVVFMLYTQPDFVVTTANLVWLCFQ